MEKKRKRPWYQAISVSCIRTRRVRLLRRSRSCTTPPRILKLASIKNRLGCSEVVEQAVQGALQEIQDYLDSLARKLRKKIAERNNVNPENLVIGAGTESLIANLFRTFFHEDEEAISASATFVGFFVYANVQNVTIKSTPLTDGYGFNP